MTTRSMRARRDAAIVALRRAHSRRTARGSARFLAANRDRRERAPREHAEAARVRLGVERRETLSPYGYFERRHALHDERSMRREAALRRRSHDDTERPVRRLVEAEHQRG